MTASTTADRARHTRSGLNRQLARVTPDSRMFAAAHLALLIHEADAGDWRTDTLPIPVISGSTAAPSPSLPARSARRWTRIRGAWAGAHHLRAHLFTWAVIVSVLVLAVVAINDLTTLAPISTAAVNR